MGCRGWERWAWHPEAGEGQVKSSKETAEAPRSSLPHLLGVGLLQQRAPELTAFLGVQEEQLPILGGQPVVHHHLHPLAVLPELRKGNTAPVHRAELRGRAGVLSGPQKDLSLC